MIVPLLLAAALGLAALLVVIQPLLGSNRTFSEAIAELPLTEAADTDAERDAKQALLDVELDHRLGNLDATDYSELRERYEERALAALKARYDRERELDARIERELAALRQQQARRQRAKARASANGTPRDAAAKSGAANGRAPGAANSARTRRRRESES
ncbi:MAG TPA: hypothetical protein VFU88_08990 [Ktedonobacterales bacterium]|nr:hypothetical protein [Ktedonobacterales bacterium]